MPGRRLALGFSSLELLAFFSLPSASATFYITFIRKSVNYIFLTS